ncbi:MAG: hypothetical protein PHZ25_03475 [Candidatus Pacebacteria bacterium]|nr:hypothetical protein [Candidatus Paceibacterota bacterium]
MRFLFTVNKLANFYFFIQNLSEWHFSNRKDYNVLWCNKVGELSLKEKDVLQQLKEIHSRHSFGKSYLGKYFFLKQDPWMNLGRELPEEDFKKIKDVFYVLEGKFDLLWNEELPLLKRWEKELQIKANDPLISKYVIDILNALFNIKVAKSKIGVYLLFSSEEHTGGGANINKKNVTIEVSRYPVENIEHVLGIIWHETIHLRFQNKHFFSLVLKQTHDRKKANLINEIVISSLFPRGILGVRIFKNKPAHKLAEEVDSIQTIKILNLTKEYVDKKKSLDKNYIESITKLLKL